LEGSGVGSGVGKIRCEYLGMMGTGVVEIAGAGMDVGSIVVSGSVVGKGDSVVVVFGVVVFGAVIFFTLFTVVLTVVVKGVNPFL
jgi:hypothetical protein